MNHAILSLDFMPKIAYLPLSQPAEASRYTTYSVMFRNEIGRQRDQPRTKLDVSVTPTEYSIEHSTQHSNDGIQPSIQTLQPSIQTTATVRLDGKDAMTVRVSNACQMRKRKRERESESESERVSKSERARVKERERERARERESARE